MTIPSLLREIYTTLQPLYDKPFQEEVRTIPGMIILHRFKIIGEIKTDTLTARCVRGILERACALAYPQERISEDFFSGDGSDPHKFTILKSGYNSVHGNRISSVFLNNLRDYSHVYLHYFCQGWSRIARHDEFFRYSPLYTGEPDIPESLYMEKKEHVTIAGNQRNILFFFAEKAGSEIFQADTQITGYGSNGRHELTTRLHGTGENLSRIFEFIRTEAEDVRVPLPLHVVRARQIEGARPLQKFNREKNRQFLEKSRSFVRV